MKFLLVHNYYQQRGGEDQVFADETALLESHGHEVVRYCLHNDAIKSMGRVSAMQRTLWNRQSHAEVRALIRQHRPALMHCHNTFPLVSPAVYSAAQREGVAVVQTLHNYRLLCPNAQFLRDGQVCEDCLGKLIALPAIRHKCYRESRSATAVLTGMLATHHALGTWRRRVDRYIALTEFARRKFASAGFPAGRVAVKPNFVAPDLGPGPGGGGFALFVGRLSVEKGIDKLVSEWAQSSNLPLKVIGDGPLADCVQAACRENPAIEWLGARPGAEVQALMGQAEVLAFPSVWYEGLPKTIVEAFSRGTPVVAARLGAMAELIEHDRTGLLFPPGDAAALVRGVSDLLNQPAKLQAMREEARREFETRYTAEQNYRRLQMIYAEALLSRGNRAAAAEILGSKQDPADLRLEQAAAEAVPAPARSRHRDLLEAAHVSVEPMSIEESHEA